MGAVIAFIVGLLGGAAGLYAYVTQTPGGAALVAHQTVASAPTTTAGLTTVWRGTNVLVNLAQDSAPPGVTVSSAPNTATPTGCPPSDNYTPDSGAPVAQVSWGETAGKKYFIVKSKGGGHVIYTATSGECDYSND